ncbi:hypothetical protein HNV12_13535 [Methanococcoides sp. SA1]|nr:hypothetical protein [Methanococcoides sp. SA1]
MAEIEQEELEVLYSNTNLPGFETYSNTINQMNEYPMYSYTVFIECRKLLIKNETENIAIEMGESEAEELLFTNIENNKSLVLKKIVATKPKTIASNEWLSLAKLNFNMAENSFKEANEYKDADFDTTIILLANSQYYLHKAENMLVLAEMRNNLNNSVDSNVILSTEKDVALRWIDSVDNEIDSNNEALDQTQAYYDEGNYYFALMLAADAKASEYTIDNKENNITLAKQRINDVDLAISSLKNNSYIDAPIVELKIELAKLHLKDAKDENSIASSLLVHSSIQESIVANEQITALLDLKNSIETPHKSTSDIEVESIPLGLFPIVGVVIAYTIRRWQSN